MREVQQLICGLKWE